MMYAAIYGLGADRTDISLSHQTFHMIQAWLEKDKRQPKDFAPQFEPKRELNEAEQMLDELVSIVAQ